MAGVTMIGWCAYLASRRMRMREMQLLRREASGLLRVELRRRVEMRSHDDGRGGRSFPQPVETRCLTWLVAELPFWSRRESVGLPPGSEARLALVSAEECDRHFATDYRLAAPESAPMHAPMVAS